MRFAQFKTTNGGDLFVNPDAVSVVLPNGKTTSQIGLIGEVESVLYVEGTADQTVNALLNPKHGPG